MMFTEACSMYLSDPRTRRRLKPSTLQVYRKDLAAAASVLPIALEQVTAANLTTYLVADVAPTTAARRLTALCGLFGWALRERHIASDPTLALEAPRRPRRLPRPIRADADRQAAERAIASAPQPFRLALTLLRETGMRVGEVFALPWATSCSMPVVKRSTCATRRTARSAWSSSARRRPRRASAACGRSCASAKASPATPRSSAQTVAPA